MFTVSTSMLTQKRRKTVDEEIISYSGHWLRPPDQILPQDQVPLSQLFTVLAADGSQLSVHQDLSSEQWSLWPINGNLHLMINVGYKVIAPLPQTGQFWRALQAARLLGDWHGPLLQLLYGLTFPSAQSCFSHFRGGVSNDIFQVGFFKISEVGLFF